MEKNNERNNTNVQDTRGITTSGKKNSRKVAPSESKRSDSNKRTASPSSHSRAITSFYGGIIPEHKGHMPRIGHSAFMYNRNFYIFGGFNARGYFTNHLCYYEKRTFQWKEIRGLGTIPPGRANHSLVFHATNKFMIYGGHRNLEVFDSLYTFNLDTNHWDKINFDASHSPGPLFLHAAVYVPTTNSMFVIGGFHQRSYNMYLGHVFDIRHCVWNGIAGPKEVDPRQLHLVTAAFHEPSASVVVIGLKERNSEMHEEVTTTFVYLLNVNTLVWTRVETARSPEAPLLFRMDIVWKTFLSEFVMMGGFYDEGQQSWYFPLNLSELAFSDKGGLGECTASPPSKSLPDLTAKSLPIFSPENKKQPYYGFFKLQLSNFTWSIVESKFPRSILKGLMAKTRERIAEQIMQRSLSQYSNILPPRAGQPRNQAGKLSTGSPSQREDNSSFKGFASLSNSLQSSTSLKRAVLFSVKDAPLFQRKYAYAAYYHTQNNSDKKKPRQFQYLIMHGGLEPGEDYAMLIFTPENSHSELPVPHQHVDFHFDQGTMPDIEGDSSIFLNAIHDNSEGAFNRVYCNHKFPLEDESMNLSFSAPDTAQRNDKDKQQTTLITAGEDGNNTHLKTHALNTNKEDTNGFALLYHENNSITHMSHLLRYPNCPVAFLESKVDIDEWSNRFYSDTRTWLAEKLKEAITRDRRERKKIKLQRQLQRNQKKDHSNPHGAVSSAFHLANLNSDSDNSAVSTSSEDDVELSEVSRGGVFETQRSSQRRNTNSSGKILPTMSFSQNLKDEKEESFQTDFFTRNRLDLFSLLPRHFSTILGIDFPKDAESDTEDEIMNLFNNMGPGRLRMNVKRRAELQRLPSEIFRTALSSKSEIAHHVGDLGSATAFVLMNNALKQLEGDYSLQACVARARIRWRFLRAMVRTGEAAFILYRVNRVETKKKAFRITSSLGLLLAPELHLVGPTRTHKVPSRPVPYVLPQQHYRPSVSAQLTGSGMVVYKNLKRNGL